MKITALISAFILLLFIYARYIEPGRITVTTIEIHNDVFARMLGDKMVLHLSDLHLNDGANPLLKQVNEKVQALHPDLIFLTGDYVEWFSGETAYRQAQTFLSGLAAENGVFAVMGDADYTLPRQSCAFCHVSHCDLTPSPWADIFLKNSSRMLQFGDTFLNVVGVDTLPAFLPDRYDFNAMTRGMPTILLTHTSLPYARLSGDTPVLVLCGDTHGGQVYLPLWIWKHAKRKPDPEHMYGFFRERNKFLVVSNGIGTSHLDLRFGRPPQIIRLSFLPEVK